MAGKASTDHVIWTNVIAYLGRGGEGWRREEDKGGLVCTANQGGRQIYLMILVSEKKES